MKSFKLDSRYVDGHVDKKKRSVKETSSSRDATAFAHKAKKVEEESNKVEEQRSTARVSYGLVSVIGRRRVMEDAVAVAINGEVDPYDLFAVYDGHGGAHVADACKNRLHLIIAKEMEARGTSGGRRLRYWEDLMAASFAKMDEEVCRCCGGGGEGDEEEREALAASMNCVGSTALVVMVGKEEVVVANCGDSRAVLCRGGGAVALSRDHKPDKSDEKERVENAGGRIVNWDGSRVLGVLATSRSIGDQYLKPYVISEPEVTVSERSPLDDFLIIASDGLWDVVSNEFACAFVKRCPNAQLKMRFPEECSASFAAKAATMLTELALARGSRDNISVIVVELKKSSSISS